jgi:ABC-type Mn2+/Zn2+ transport system ATPase subunit
LTDRIKIEARDLSFSYEYPTVKALDRVSFSIKEGSFLAVIGPNGSGKTTLLRMMLGLLQPESGSLEVMGYKPWQDQSSVQKLIGYVPQYGNVNERLPMRVIEVVMQGLQTRRGISISKQDFKDRVTNALDMVELGDLADRPFGTLSGGQRQRTLIARAVAVNPEILILDEPFAAVDISSQQTIAHLLNKLSREQGVTVVAVAHNVNVLVHYLSSIMILANRLVAYGAPSEVLKPDILRSAYGVEVPVIVCDDGYLHPIMEAAHDEVH